MIKKTTELRNQATMTIDQQSTQAILQTINREDQKVPQIISQPQVIQAITQVVDQVVHSFKQGGRLFYMGAGTSGRLGVLDAAECVPTYGTDPELVQGLIAGGDQALTLAVEGAEDSPDGGRQDLKSHQLTAQDFVLGLAASGSTPYVLGGLDYARELGAKTGALSCNQNAIISHHADYAIEAVVGPEVVTGSTRMKAGTAEKLILNMISTTAMIQMGKVYGNLMVDVKPTNVKLVDRAQRIIQEATGVDRPTAAQYFTKAKQQPKVAIVMINGNCDYQTAEKVLQETQGFIAKALQRLQK